MPFFSIITVVKNNISTIERTIKSVLEQNFSNFEYIIVDGNSDDGTKELIQRYSLISDKIVFLSENDNGLFFAMNKGISLSKGNYISLLNSDDYYFSQNVLNDYFQLIRSRSISTLSVVYSGMKISFKNNLVKDLPPDLKYLEKNMRMNHPTWFVGKDVYLKIGNFNTQYRIASDYEFALRSYVNNIEFVELKNSFPVVFSIGGNSTISLKSVKESFEIRKKYNLIGTLKNYYFLLLELFDLFKAKLKSKIFGSLF